MKITKVTIQRVKNLGDYESKRLELTAELNEDDDLDAAIASLEAVINNHLGIPNKSSLPKTLVQDGLPF